MQSCERERMMLALADLDMEFRQLTQRANRANVSFYPLDPRGLVVSTRQSDPTDRRGRRQTPRSCGGARTACARWRPRPTARSCSTPTSSGRAAAAHRCGLLLSAGLHLDQPEARRPLSPAHRPCEKAGRHCTGPPGLSAPTAAEGWRPRRRPPRRERRAASARPCRGCRAERTAPPMYLQAAGGAGYLQVVCRDRSGDRCAARVAERRLDSRRVRAGRHHDDQSAGGGDRARGRQAHIRREASGARPPAAGPLPGACGGEGRRRPGAAQALHRGHGARRQCPARLGRRGVASRFRHRTAVRAFGRPATGGPNAWWSRRRSWPAMRS